MNYIATYTNRQTGQISKIALFTGELEEALREAESFTPTNTTLTNFEWIKSNEDR